MRHVFPLQSERGEAIYAGTISALLLALVCSVASAQTANNRVTPSARVVQANEAGDYQKAIELIKGEIQSCKRIHPSVLPCLTLLSAGAQVAVPAGDAPLAEEFAREALRLARTKLGTDHVDTATNLNNLATSLGAQGRFAEAAPYFRESLTILRKLYGVKHVFTSVSLSGLAECNQALGRLEEAERFGREALAIREEVLGQQNLYTADSYHTLGLTLTMQGRYSEAESLIYSALKTRQAALGNQHAITARSYAGLAQLFTIQGRHDDAEPLLQRVLSINSEVLGEKHPETVAAYHNLARSQYAQGRYSDADASFRKSLTVAMDVFGPSNVFTATVQSGLAESQLALGRLDEAEALIRSALDIRRAEFGDRHELTAESNFILGHVTMEQGRFVEAEPLLESALDVRRDVLGEGHAKTALSYHSIGANLFGQGRVSEAMAPLQQALEIRIAVLGRKHPVTAENYGAIAACHRALGEFAEADRLHRQALDIFRSVDEKHPNVAGTLNQLGLNYQAQGNFAEAERHIRQALELNLEVLGEEHAFTAATYSNAAQLLTLQGRSEEAVELYKQALAILQVVYGAQHPSIATVLNNIAHSLDSQGLYQQAEAIHRESLEMNQSLRGDAHPETNTSFNNLGLNLFAQRRYAEAAPLLQKAVDIQREVLGERHPRVATSMTNLAGNYFFLGKPAQALKLVQDSLDIRLEVLDEGHPEIIESQAVLSSLYRGVGKEPSTALSLARDAADSLGSWQAESGSSWDGLRQGLGPRWIHTVHLGAAWFQAISGVSSDTETALRSEAFEAAQSFLTNSTGQAVAQVAARFAAGDGSLAEALRETQDLTRELDRLDERLVAAFSAGEKSRAQDIRKLQSDALDRLSRLDDQISKEFPQYKALANPTPLSIEDVQKSLSREDAVVVLLSLQREIFAFAVSSERVLWHHKQISASDIEDRIAVLRCQVDRHNCTELSDTGTTTDRAISIRQRERQSPRGPVYDRSAAYSLYRDLIGPLEPVIGDTSHLYVVTHGALSSFPFGALVTKAPTPDEDDSDPIVLRNTAWLGARFAMTTLPTVASLKSFPDENRKIVGEFIGVGDPIPNPRHVRLSTSESDRSIRFATGATPGTSLADPASLRFSFSRLVYAAVELENMAAELGVDPAEVLFLQMAATEKTVKELDLRRRVLAFGTHGFLAGELPNLGEPGLILTPPDKATQEDDGLLTASEVTQLKLAADWVILSACNTAGEDGKGGESLSGLARAFFYAGARNLLASHWRVDDSATATLTVETIRASEAVDKATALKNAMTFVRTGRSHDGRTLPGWNPDWAHPKYWAPFVLVGTDN